MLEKNDTGCHFPFRDLSSPFFLPTRTNAFHGKTEVLVPRYTVGGVKKQAYWGYETWGVLGSKEGVGTSVLRQAVSRSLQPG